MNSELRGRAHQSELEGMPHYSPCVKYRELFPKAGNLAGQSLRNWVDGHYFFQIMQRNARLQCIIQMLAVSPVAVWDIYGGGSSPLRRTKAYRFANFPVGGSA